MSELIRFPSGKTVTQAKKDAKKIAKIESLPLNDAQDLIASENGLKMPWKDAMKHLNNEFKPVANFSLGNHHFQLTKSKPICFMSGYSGTGKTVVSLLLAEQHLKAGQHVHIESWGLGIKSESTDLALTYLRKLKTEFKKLFTFNDRPLRNTGADPWRSLMARLHPNTLFIMDEVYMISDELPLDIIMGHIQKKSCAVVIAGQGGDDFERVGFSDDFDSYAGMILLGRGSASNDGKYPGLGQILDSRLDIVKDKYTEFFALDGNGWADVVRIKNPLAY